MNYLRGSEDRLTGRALIFLELKDPQVFMDSHQVEMKLLGVFCAASEVDLLELIVQVMHIPREHSTMISRFYKRYFQEIEKIKCTFPARISKIIDEVIEEQEEEIPEQVREAFREMFHVGDSEEAEKEPNKLPGPEFYSTIIPLPDRDFLAPYAVDDFQFDVIDLERSKHLEVGHLILDAHARLYVADYMNQKEKQIEFVFNKEYVSPFKNYKEMSKGEFKRVLIELSSELMFLIETGRETDRVFADLTKLTSGSYLLGEVVQMYNISTTTDPNKIKLMELYFRKIFSLLDENYLLTKQISEEIQKYTV